MSDSRHNSADGNVSRASLGSQLSGALWNVSQCVNQEFGRLSFAAKLEDGASNSNDATRSSMMDAPKEKVWQV